jgi:AhpD family alkylhydroperoxidase
MIMSHAVTMPALSDTMGAGRLVKWIKKPGDQISKGDVIAEVETDKAVMDVEAFQDGYLSGPLVAEGTEAPIGEIIGYIADKPDEIRSDEASVSTAPLSVAANDKASASIAAAAQSQVSAVLAASLGSPRSSLARRSRLEPSPPPVPASNTPTSHQDAPIPTDFRTSAAIHRSSQTAGIREKIMSKNFPARRQELQGLLVTLGREIPGPMAEFSDLHKAARAEGALSSKVKELIALSIAVAQRCDSCIAFHVHDALAAGATRPEVLEALGVAVMMGGGPATMYACDALAALEQFDVEQK